MRFLLCGINAKYIHSNLAIFSLKAYADRKKIPGAEIILKEYTINNYVEDILQDLYEEKADVVIFSCYIWNISFVRELAAELKKVSPDVKIWAGGPEVSYAANKFLMENPAFDLIMQGEGEEVFSELIRLTVEEKCRIKDVYKQSESKKVLSEIVEKRYSIERKQAVKEEKDIEDKHFAGEDNVYPTNYIDMSKLQKLQGIAVRDFSGEVALGNAESNIGNKTKIINTGFATLMDMDTIPFVYEDFHLFEHKILYYETSRGCPFSCSYCLSSIDKCLRFRNLELVKKELQFFIDHEVPQVKFVDRTFNCKHDHAMAIWNYIKEHDKGITNFHFEVAADLLNEEEIELIRSLRPGLIQLEIGIQSTNKQTIKEINRSMNLEKVRDKVARIHEKGNVHQHLDLIAGLPYENYDSFAHSFNEVYAMEPDQFQLGFLKVLHGSVMHEKMKEYELLCQNRPPYEVLSTKWLPYSDVIRLKKVEEMVEVYYNSFQFSHTMRLLVELFPSAFSMYEKMGNYYEKKGLFGLNHSRLARYEILWDFVESELAEFTCSEKMQKKEADFKEKVLESMTLDLYLRDNVKNRPAFLGESKVEKDVASEFYKKEAEEHKYLKDYEGYDSRQLRKMTHLERLNGKLHLFDYRHRNKLNQDAAIYIIED